MVPGPQSLGPGTPGLRVSSRRPGAGAGRQGRAEGSWAGALPTLRPGLPWWETDTVLCGEPKVSTGKYLMSTSDVPVSTFNSNTADHKFVFSVNFGAGSHDNLT